MKPCTYFVSLSFERLICSVELSVFEGRSYTAKVETFGNAQLSPMQFFYLKNHTIFTGLYQIIKVEHNITPNDMTTEFQGIKMRYGGNSGYGGVLPITLDDYRDAASVIKNAPLEVGDTTRQDDTSFIGAGDNGGRELGVSGSGTVSDANIQQVDVGQGGVVSTTDIQIPPDVKNYFLNTDRFATSDNGAIPKRNGKDGRETRASMIKNMNEFLADRWAPFARFMAENYPKFKRQIAISSAIRTSSNSSQHNKGEACDFGFGKPSNSNLSQRMGENFDLLNALMQFHRVNNLHFDQIL